MEYEVRYYYPSDEIENILGLLEKQEGLKKHARRYEKTTQFDHPCKGMSFYTKEVDGRFRVRITKSEDVNICKISWKRRLEKTTFDEVNKEEEVELSIQPDEYENLMFIVEKVLKMKAVESYERYRTIFENDEVEIAVDEYPFGIALEIENRSQKRSPIETVKEWVKQLGLDIGKAYRLSWDDKYAELCKKQNIEKYNHVTFDLPMPKVE